MRLQILLVLCVLIPGSAFLGAQSLPSPQPGVTASAVSGPNVDNLSWQLASVLTWKPPSGVSVHKKAYGIKEHNDKWCSTLIGVDFLADHLANFVYRRKDSLFIRYDDLNAIKAMLKKGKDGFAIDIVQREQFACDGPNDLHESFAHDGVLLKPVYKGKLLRGNLLEKKDQFEVFMGKVPSGMKGDLEYNVLTIKHKCLCRYSSPLGASDGDLSMVAVDIPWDTVGFEPITRSTRRYLDFVVPFKKEEYVYKVSDVQPMLDSVKALGRYITRIDIKAYASVEGTKTLNTDLYNKRAEGIYNAIQSQQKEPILLSRQAYENWSDFRVDVLNTSYAWLLGLTREQIKDTMAANDKIWRELEPTLAPHRKAEVRVFLSQTWLDTLGPKQVLQQYKRTMEQGKPDSALFFQSMLLRAFERGELLREVLLRTEIPIRKGMSYLHANRFNMARRIGDPDYINWYIRKADSILPFGVNCPPLRALYLDWRIRDLNYNPGIHKRLPFEYAQQLDLLERDGFSTELANRMRLNFHLAGVTWSEKHEDLNAREQALNAIHGLFKPSRLNDKELVRLGRFFNKYLRIRWTLDMLQPLVAEGNEDPEVLFQYLGAALFYQQVVGEKRLTELTLLAKDLDKARVCRWYRDFPQLARNEWLKPILCDACGE